MACGSGCCGPPAAESSGPDPSNQYPTTGDQDGSFAMNEHGPKEDQHSVATPSCDDECCDGPTEEARGKKPAAEPTSCQDECCSGPTEERQAEQSSYQDECCSGLTEKSMAEPIPCKDKCCGGPADELQAEQSSSCQDKCCGGPAEELQAEQGSSCQDECCNEPTRKLVAEPTPCQDECCGGPNAKFQAETASCQDACCGGPIEETCQDACCGGQSIEPQNSTGCKIPEANIDPCCDPKALDPSCNKSTPGLQRFDATGSPDCCDGKTAPCCDEACLDRLALRECENHELSPASSHVTGSVWSSASSDCKKGRDGKPCADHVRKTRQMYAEKLEALGCICRALLALGQESCCTSKRNSFSGGSRRRYKKMPSPRSSVDSCCAPGTPKPDCCSSKKRPRTKKKCGGRSRTECTTKSRPPSLAGSCIDSCCVGEKPTSPAQKPAEIFVGASAGADIEKGLPVDEKEHVILSISGMTCTGCETKLIRTLGPHPSVRNLKTSLVLARVEFDLVGTDSAVDVMKHLERTTEFKCERITNQGSSLDVIAPDGDAAAFANKPWPDGVTDVTIVDKKIVHVSFDARVVGARELVNRGWSDGPVQLAPQRPDQTIEVGSKHVRHLSYMTLLSACLTIPVLVMAWAPLPERPLAYGSASLALATLVQVFIAGPFYPKALKAIVFSRVIEMDLLVVLSTSAAYVFSVVSFGYMVAGRPLSTGGFFETSTLLVTLIMVGRWASALARQKAVESISIRSLQTPFACLVTDQGETEIDARLLQYGDVFKIVPDSRVPTDGTVIFGSSEVDESMITGESKLVEKHPKSPVIAGSVNGSGILHARLTRLPGDNTISTIAGMVDEAKLSKPKIQDIADRIASYFVPVVISFTIATFCIWLAIGIRVRRQDGSDATIEAITYAITVLIVSCPCAIGLAVPMVIVIASGVAAERGVIFKSAECIEVAYKTSHVVFDKTGTLTEGKLSVVREWYSDNNQGVTQSLLLGLVSSIKHPVSLAVARHLQSLSVTPSKVSDTKTLTGKGVQGTAKDSRLVLRAGNSRWLGLDSDPFVQSVLSQGFTAFCLTIDGSVAAVFGLRDSVRSDAASTVKTLLDRGIAVHMVSGDDDGAVRSIAAQLGIAGENVRSRCTPAAKQAYILDLLEGSALPKSVTNGKKARKPVVIFCGDGTNDAVALAQATIGVHMNEVGTAVAQSAADVVLMRPDLGGILTTIAVSKKAIRRIAFNFGWSFVYNLFAILLAAGAFVNARIPPQFAGLGELVSVLPVIAAAMLLRWSKI